MKTSQSSGGQMANTVVDSRRVARGLCRSGVLAALAALAFLASGMPLFGQGHSNTGTASLGLQVNPAVLLTNDGSSNVFLWIRLGTGGNGSLWGDSSTSNCNTPIGTAKPVSTSGKLTYALNAIPFTTSDALICAYDPGPPSSSSSLTWPHTDASLAFLQQPTNAVSGATISPAVTVQVLDSNGVVDTTNSTASVSLAITGGGTLGGTTMQTAVNGVATFNNLSIAAGGTYTLTATSGSLTLATSSSFSISGGTLDHFKVEKSGGGAIGTQTAGTAFNLRITAQDVNNNTVTSFTSTATLTSNGTLTGSPVTSGSFVAGVLDPQSVTITSTGTAVTITATSGAKTGTSASFTVNAGTATQVRVETAADGSGTVVPAQNLASGSTLTVYAISRDASNNFVANVSATWSLASITGGVVSGDLSPTSGTSATFTGHVIGTAAIHAVSGSLTSTNSGTITVTPGSLASFTFTLASPQTDGVAFTGMNTLTAKDGSGNTVINFNASTNNVTITANSPLTGTVSGIHGSNVLNGSGDFTNGVANLTSLGMIYAGNAATGTFTATSGGKTGTSGSVAINVGSAAKFVITGTGTQTAGASQTITITAQDAGGNTVTTYTGSHSLTFSGADPSTNPITKPTVNGTAFGTATSITFTTGASNGTRAMVLYDAETANVSATDGSISSSGAGNLTVVVSAGTATKMVYTTQPGNGTGGSPFNPQPVVTIEDAYGNTETSSIATITISISANTGGGTLSGTTSVNAVAGVATFTNLSINKPANSYTLSVSGVGSAVISNGFNITVGPAAKLFFTTSPGGSLTGGSPFTTQPVVTLEDAGGNTVTSDNTDQVTLAITSGTGTSGATFSCTTNPKTASSGIASFAGCKINLVGTGYTLTATSGSLTSATSSAFNISLGIVAAVTVETANNGTGTLVPTQSVTAGNSITVYAIGRDAGGNFVANESAAWSLQSITGGVSAATDLIPTSGNTTSATFTAHLAGSATIHAVYSSFSGNSGTITAQAGSASKLVFTTQPGGGTGGTAWTTQPVVTVEDAGGNTISSSASIQLAIGTNPGGGTLTCTTNPQNATSGVDTFAGCNINKTGTGYTLTAISSGLTTATSGTFNITLGSAAQLAFTTQPGGGTAGTAWTTQPVVTVEDAGGNKVTSSSASITLAITSGTPISGGPGTLTCTANPKSASSGVDTFAGCKISTAGTGYSLTATSSGLTSAISSAFND